MSKPALDKISPDNPPMVNKNKNPNTNDKLCPPNNTEFHKVAIQLKILTPVGTAITIVAAVK